MAFDSRHDVVVHAPARLVYESLSSADNFARFLHLSPTCHSVEIVGTDHVLLSDPATLVERSLQDVALHRPEYTTMSLMPPDDQRHPCIRIRFEMVERIPVAFGMLNNDVKIVGTQVMIPEARLHIYESSANNGVVKIYKLRRFFAVNELETRIEELIVGKTNRLLRYHTQSACRKAHQEHMRSYQSLFV